MGSAAQYWRLVRIGASGQRKIEEIEAAKSFFQQQFSNLIEQINLPDTLIQEKLIKLYQEGATTDCRQLAGYCLRCFVSQQIEQVCVQLELKFGSKHGFDRRDLFPFVLDDQGFRSSTERTIMQYRSLAMDIIETFDPKRSTLGAWTFRQVRHYQELNRFLQERGVYLITDWAILNDTSLGQLQRVLPEFYHLTPVEVGQACQLLEGYHEIYREARRRQALKAETSKREKCTAPTEEQLEQISQHLIQEAGLKISNAGVLRRLEVLASQLRQYRLYKRGGGLPTDSFDRPEVRIAVESVHTPEQDANEELNEFLTFYRDQLLFCLDQAITQATTERCVYLQGKSGKKREKAEKFLIALKLLHCEGLMMAEIAPRIGLEAQYQVTQLVKLKEFRSMVRQKLLGLLSDCILDQAKLYADPQRLHELDCQIEVALEEQVSELIQQAEREMFLGKRTNSPNSLFAQRVCYSLCHH